MDQPKQNLELIDGGPWMTALSAGRYSEVIRGARVLRTQGCIGAFHLELLATIAQRTSDGISDATRLVDTLVARDLYDRAPELLEARKLWLDTSSWFLHHELGKHRTVSSGERLEELILGELGIIRGHASAEETAAFKALALIQEGNLDGAFDQLFDAAADSRDEPHGMVFRRAGHTLFQAVPRKQRLDVLRYSKKRGKTPSAYGLAPFPGRGFLIKEYSGAASKSDAQLLGRAPVTLSPIMTAGWINGWTIADGFPETRDFERVENLLNKFSQTAQSA